MNRIHRALKRENFRRCKIKYTSISKQFLQAVRLGKVFFLINKNCGYILLLKNVSNVSKEKYKRNTGFYTYVIHTRILNKTQFTKCFKAYQTTCTKITNPKLVCLGIKLKRHI